MPAIVGSYEGSTHDHGIAQNGRKTHQNGPVAHLTDGKKRQAHTISCHRTVIRKVHRLLGQKIDLRYPRATECRFRCRQSCFELCVCRPHWVSFPSLLPRHALLGVLWRRPVAAAELPLQRTDGSAAPWPSSWPLAGCRQMSTIQPFLL
jgi:hypothetical protein